MRKGFIFVFLFASFCEANIFENLVMRSVVSGILERMHIIVRDFIACGLNVLRVVGEQLSIGAGHMLGYLDTGNPPNATTFHGEIASLLTRSFFHDALREPAIVVVSTVVQEFIDRVEEGFEDFSRSKMARLSKSNEKSEILI